MARLHCGTFYGRPAPRGLGIVSVLWSAVRCWVCQFCSVFRQQTPRPRDPAGRGRGLRPGNRRVSCVRSRVSMPRSPTATAEAAVPHCPRQEAPQTHWLASETKTPEGATGCTSWGTPAALPVSRRATETLTSGSPPRRLQGLKWRQQPPHCGPVSVRVQASPRHPELHPPCSFPINIVTERDLGSQ